jgi:hypothetical protein
MLCDGPGLVFPSFVSLTADLIIAVAPLTAEELLTTYYCTA